MLYEVTLTEQHEHCFEVDANSPEDAKEKAYNLYEDCIAKKTLPYSDHDFWIDDDNVSELEEADDAAPA